MSNESRHIEEHVPRVEQIELSESQKNIFKYAKWRRITYYTGANNEQLPLPGGMKVLKNGNNSLETLRPSIRNIFKSLKKKDIFDKNGTITSANLDRDVFFDIIQMYSTELHNYIIDHIRWIVSIPCVINALADSEYNLKVTIRKYLKNGYLIHHRDKAKVSTSLSLCASTTALDMVPWDWELWDKGIKPRRIYIPENYTTIMVGDAVSKWTHGLPRHYKYNHVRYTINVSFT